MSSTRQKWRYAEEDLLKLSPFGSVLVDRMPLARFDGSSWSDPKLISINDFQLHPGAHCLHYGSACFEGLKAYRWKDGTLAVFRADQHAARMIKSAEILRLPVPSAELFLRMVHDVVRSSAEHIPPAPGALYLRPVLIGTDHNIGAASTPSKSAALYVLASPVGDYFAGGDRALRLLIEDQHMRSTPQFGQVKTGANYAAALGMTLDAKKQWQVDQLLFCPGGDVQETGASNFILVGDKTVVTKPLSSSFLHGVTRDSVLQLARDVGYETQERDITVDELLAWTKHGEAALTGTAAVLAGVGSLVYQGKEYMLSNAETGPNTQRLRQALCEIQQGIRADEHDWIAKVAWKSI